MMLPGPYTFSSCAAKGDAHTGETLFLLYWTALPYSEELHQAEVFVVTGTSQTRRPAEDVACRMSCPLARLWFPFVGDKLVHPGVKCVQ